MPEAAKPTPEKGKTLIKIQIDIITPNVMNQNRMNTNTFNTV